MEQQCKIHQKEIQNLAEEIDKIHDQMFKIGTLEKKVDKILYYLESDGATNQKGLVEKTESNQFEIYKLKEKISIYEAKAGLLGFIGAGIFTFVAWFVKYLIVFK